MGKKVKVSYIAISKKMLYDNEISSKAKYLYIILRTHSMNDIVNIKYPRILESLRWNDLRTLKRYLSQLENAGYIKIKSDRYNKHLPVNLSIPVTKSFILIDRELIEKAMQYESYEKGLLYLYMMEDCYNVDWRYSCPSFRKIQNVTKMPNKELKKVMDIYHDNYICEYSRGVRIGEDLSHRTSNRYLPNVMDKNGNRRYEKHKRKIYFFGNEFG